MTFKTISARRCAIVPLLVISIGLSAQANAVSLPSAGSLDNQLNQDAAHNFPSRPIEAPLHHQLPTEQRPEVQDDTATVRVERVRFDGAEILSEEELQHAVLPWVQRDVTMAELNAMMAAVEFRYRQRGYLAVSVVLPVQNMQDGELKLLVTIGRYMPPVVSTQDEREQDFLSQLVLRATCTQACDGQTLIETAQVDRALYVLNDLPGVSAKGRLKAGLLPGTSLLDVNVAAIKKVGGYVELNNHGNPFSGREVLNAGAQLNTALLVGDQLTFDAVSSLEALQHATGLQKVASSYSLPVGTLGTRFGTGFSHLEYRLNQEYEMLDAHGKADSISGWLKHPLWLSHAGRMDMRLAYEQSRYADSLLRRVRKRDVNASTFDLSGNLYGNLQIAGWRLSSTVGTLTYHDPNDQLIDSKTRKSAGHFALYRLEAFGLQGLGHNWELYGALRGQLANRNLDSSQGFVMGGPNAVRAYDGNTPSVDEGWQGSLELRYPYQVLGMRLTAAAFYDAAQGRVNHHAWGVGNDTQLRLSGAGAYLAGTLSNQYNIRLTYAQRLRDNILDPVDSDQLWLSLSTVF